VGKGTTVERLEITQRRENSRAGNYVSGPKIPPQGRNFRLQRFVKGLEILVWQNFRGPEIP
jgi:hypothetical protein